MADHAPFRTTRAKARAPQALAFAGITGAAMVISRTGRIALESATAPDLDTNEVARRAIVALLGHRSDVVSFGHHRFCVHAVWLTKTWAFCVVSTADVPLPITRDRLERARRVLTLALRDGDSAESGPVGGSSGAPAEVSVFAPLRR